MRARVWSSFWLSRWLSATVTLTRRSASVADLADDVGEGVDGVPVGVDIVHT
jgi:hypothetical protein